MITAEQMENEITSALDSILKDLKSAGCESLMPSVRRIRDEILTRLKLLELAQAAMVAEENCTIANNENFVGHVGAGPCLTDISIRANAAWRAEWLKQKGAST
jgi:hypothetical protein